MINILNLKIYLYLFIYFSTFRNVFKHLIKLILTLCYDLLSNKTIRINATLTFIFSQILLWYDLIFFSFAKDYYSQNVLNFVIRESLFKNFHYPTKLC